MLGGDESGSVRETDPGTYIFGAVLTAPDSADIVRERLRLLALPGQKKTHWRDESAKHRDRLIETIGDCGLESIVVVRVGPLDERDERRRRKCFEILAPLLVKHEVSHLTLESRGTVADQRDVEMVRALGAAGVVPTSFRLSHTIGLGDPLLWAADAVCGAVVSARTGQPKWLRRLERLVAMEVVSRPR